MPRPCTPASNRGKTVSPIGLMPSQPSLMPARAEIWWASYAAGGIYAGFANALGQRNWFASFTFNCDWSFYYQSDKAVKTGYAGFVWEPAVLARKVAEAAEQLDMLRRPPHTIPPGHYRVYLAPAALYDILQMLAWGGFGLKDHRTKQTTLLKMVEEGVKSAPSHHHCVRTPAMAWRRIFKRPDSSNRIR